MSLWYWLIIHFKKVLTLFLWKMKKKTVKTLIVFIIKLSLTNALKVLAWLQKKKKRDQRQELVKIM